MAFSDDAIGFFLALEDQLSPALATAEENYRRFVRMLDKHNQRAFRSANQGMEALAEVVEAFTSLPKKAEQAYAEALRRLDAKARPIEQRVDLIFTAKASKDLGRVIGEAVAKVLAKSKLRLTAEIPSHRSKLFDTRVALRTAYRGQTQPPDMAGMFEGLPRFAEGGIVGGRGDIDKVLALLTPGEMVLPKKVAESLRAMAELQKGERLAGGLSQAVADIENLAKGLERVQDLTETGLDPSAVKTYAAGVAALNQRYKDLLSVVGGISDKRMPQFIGVVKDAKVQVDRFAKALDKAKDEGKDLEKIKGPVRFLAGRAIVEDFQKGLQMLRSGVRTTFDLLGTGEQIGTFIQNFERVNSRLNLSREGLASLRHEFADTVGRLAPAGLDINLASDAFADLVDVTGSGDKAMQELAVTLATVRQATKASEGTVTGLANTLMRIGGLDRDSIAIVFERGRVAAQGTRTTAEQLYEQSQQFAERGGENFRALSQEQKVAYLSNLQSMSAALSKVASPEVAKEIAEVSAAAFAGAPEAIQRFTQITGMNLEDLRGRLIKTGGDLTPIATSFQRLAGLSSTGFETWGQAVGLAGDSVAALANQGKPAVEAMKQQQATVISAADAHKGLAGALAGTTSKTKTFVNDLNTSLGTYELWGVNAGEVVDVFAEMPTSFVLAGLELTKFTGNLLTKGIPALVQWTFASKAVETATAAASMATGAASTAAAPAAGGVAAALTALASGLVALTPAIPVILTLTAAIIGIGFAVMLAKEPLIAFANVIGAVFMKAIDAVVEVVKVMATLGAAEMFALAGSLLLLGPALLSLGAGIFAMSGFLLLSIPGLVGFTGALKLMGVLTGTTASIAGVIQALAAAFMVDPALMQQAVESVWLSVKFLAGFAVASAALTALAGAATIGQGVSSLLSFFGVKSPFETLKDEAVTIRDTIVSVAKTFGEIPAGQASALRKSADTVSAVAAFTKNYSAVAADLRGISDAGLRDTTWFGFWKTKGPLSLLKEEAPAIKSTVTALVDTFAGMAGSFSEDRVKSVTDVVGGIAKVTSAVAPVFKSLQEMGAASSGLQDVSVLFGLLVKEGPLTSMIRLMQSEPAGEGLLDRIDELMIAFTRTHVQISADRASNFVGQVTPISSALSAMASIFKSLGEIGDAAGKLRGWTSSSSTFKILDDVVPKLAPTLNTLGTEFGKITAPDAAVRGALTSVSASLVEVKTLMGAMQELGAATKGLDTKSLALTATTTKNVVTAAGTVRQSLTDALGTATTSAEIPVLSVQAQVVPAATRAMIEQAIMVKLDPNMTDAPVHAALQKTNELLGELLAAVRSEGGVRAAPVQEPARGRPANALARDIAAGAR